MLMNAGTDKGAADRKTAPSFNGTVMLLVVFVVTAAMAAGYICGRAAASRPTSQAHSVGSRPPADAGALPPDIAIEDGLLKFRGEVIRPQAFKGLDIMPADVMPIARTVDLEGYQDTERHGIEEPIIYRKMVRYGEPHDEHSRPRGYYAYCYMGRLDNGMHVVRGHWNTGGTLVSESLLLVTFGTVPLLGDEYRSTQMVMECHGRIGLGDRYDGTIEFTGNRIEIGEADGPGPEYYEAKTIILPDRLR